MKQNLSTNVNVEIHKGRIEIPDVFYRKLQEISGRQNWIDLLVFPDETDGFPYISIFPFDYNLGFVRECPLSLGALRRGISKTDPYFVSLDKNILHLPKHLLKETGIGKEATLVGLLRHFELWNPKYFHCREDEVLFYGGKAFYEFQATI